MNILTHIGEATALINGQEYLVRPSFKALASVGDPKDLAQCISDVYTAYAYLVQFRRLPRSDYISACANLLELCSDIPPKYLGYLTASASGKRVLYRQGKISPDEIIIMANHCIRWGVGGDPKHKPQPVKDTGRPQLFDPAEFVAILIDEFHMSREDAWGATMTEFQRLCEQRQRKAWGDKPPPPTKEEAKASFDYAKNAIARARAMSLKPTKGRR